MTADNMKRFSVTLSEPILRLLDEYCDIMGVTRNGAIASMVARQLISDKELIRALQVGAICPEDIILQDEIQRQKMVDEGVLESAY